VRRASESSKASSKAGTKSSASKNRLEPVNAETKESSGADVKNEELINSKQADSGTEPVQQQ
jgi:hypothetical protein